MSRVHIGTIGWNYPAWDQGYFPDDIPEDWKLAFYANDFSAVALPEQFWAGESLEAVCEQLADLDSDFAVYCLVQTRMPAPELITKVKAAIGNFFAGFIVSENVDLEVIAERHDDFIVFAESPVSGKAADRYWSTLPVGTDLKLSVVKLKGHEDLKVLRQQFESVQGQLDGENDVFVMVSPDSPGSEPSIDFLQQLRTLLELMAIA